MEKGWTGMNRDVHGPRTYLCVVDVLPVGQYAALEVEAPDALAAERMAVRTLGDRYETIEVIDIVRTDDFVPAH
jgi:hypothetical protein